MLRTENKQQHVMQHFLLILNVGITIRKNWITLVYIRYLLKMYVYKIIFTWKYNEHSGVRDILPSEHFLIKSLIMHTH